MQTAQRLQVHVSKHPGSVIVQVKGALVYPGTRTLRATWQQIQADPPTALRILDLTGVRQVDSDGADLLREILRSGFRPLVQDAALRDLLHSIQCQIREANIQLEFDELSRTYTPRLNVMAR